MTDLNPIKDRLQEAVKEHAPELDGWLFNGGTLLTLLLTAGASLCGLSTGWSWLGAVFSAAAGILVAGERALSFGPRWRFHQEMRNSYRSLIDMIEFANLLPEGEEKAKYVKNIWTALYALRSRDSAIPGAGTAPQ